MLQKLLLNEKNEHRPRPQLQWRALDPSASPAQPHLVAHRIQWLAPTAASATLRAVMDVVQQRADFIYRVTLPLSAFLEPDMLLKLRCRKLSSDSRVVGTLIAVSLDGGGLDQTDCCVQITAEGDLCLSLSKDLYEQVGLQGSSCPAPDAQTRYVVRIDMVADNFVPGNKLYDRVLWCFQNKLTRSMNFLIASTRELSFPESYRCKKIPLQIEVSTMNAPMSAPRPDLATLTTSDVVECIEWFGLIQCNAYYLLSKYKTMDPYIATYAEPSLCSTSAGEGISSIVLRGFIHPFVLEFIAQEMANRPMEEWQYMHVRGWQDTVVDGTGKPHFYFENGDQDMAVWMWKEKQKEGILINMKNQNRT